MGVIANQALADLIIRIKQQIKDKKKQKTKKRITKKNRPASHFSTSGAAGAQDFVLFQYPRAMQPWLCCWPEENKRGFT
jgi:hypothetical protein